MPTTIRPSSQRRDVITDHIEGVEDGAEDEQAEEAKAPEAEQEDEPVVDSTTEDDKYDDMSHRELAERQADLGIGYGKLDGPRAQALAGLFAVSGLIASAGVAIFVSSLAIIPGLVIACIVGALTFKDILDQDKEVSDYLSEGELDEDSEEFKEFTPYQRHLARHKEREKEKNNKGDYKFLHNHRIKNGVLQLGLEEKLKVGVVKGAFYAVTAAGVAVAGIGSYMALGLVKTAAISLIGLLGVAVIPFAAALAVVFLGYRAIKKWDENRVETTKEKIRETQNRLIAQKLEERKGLVDADIEEMGEEIQELQDDIDVAEAENETIDEVLRTGKEDGEEISEARRRQLRRQRANNQDTINQNNETLYGLDSDEDGGLVDQRDALVDERKAIDEDLEAIENADDSEDIDFKSDSAKEVKSDLEKPKHVAKKFREQKFFGMQTVRNTGSFISETFGAAVRTVSKKFFYFATDEYKEKRKRVAAENNMDKLRHRDAKRSL